MNHVKEIELFERRNLKDYLKYRPFIKERLDAFDVEIFDTSGIIQLVITINPNPDSIPKERLLDIFDYFMDYDLKIFIKCNYIRLEVIVDNKFFTPFDIEITSKKYNI
jgi:hypothetical protein